MQSTPRGCAAFVLLAIVITVVGGVLYHLAVTSFDDYLTVLVCMGGIVFFPLSYIAAYQLTISPGYIQVWSTSGLKIQLRFRHNNRRTTTVRIKPDQQVDIDPTTFAGLLLQSKGKESVGPLPLPIGDYRVAYRIAKPLTVWLFNTFDGTETALLDRARGRGTVTFRVEAAQEYVFTMEPLQGAGGVWRLDIAYESPSLD